MNPLPVKSRRQSGSSNVDSSAVALGAEGNKNHDGIQKDSITTRSGGMLPTREKLKVEAE